jgi:phenylacetate-CoA ligase
LTYEVWPEILAAAELRPDDRLLFPFSFGPFIGFWAAFEGAQHTGRFVLAGGGASSTARLQLIREHEITVAFCTPTYALRLIEVARAEGFDLAGSRVRAVIVAGEPGGSIPATRACIERGFGARVFDHSGMTEIGSLSAEYAEEPGKLFILEDHFLVEFLDPTTLRAVPEGELGELVVTNLGRWDSPAIRYRTGDLVRWRQGSTPRRARFPFVHFEGGVLARLDDMLWIKGNNVYPSAVEAVLRALPGLAEYRLEASPTGDDLTIVVEPTSATSGDFAEIVAKAVQDRLYFRPKVTIAPIGSLPRFEMKASRFVRREV